MKNTLLTCVAAIFVAGPVAAGADYTGAGFDIPDLVASGASSVISVSGDTLSITSLEVTLVGLTHTWIGDVVATISAPSGTVFPLFTRVGLSTTSGGAGDSTNLGGSYIFRDSAVSSLWASAQALGADAAVPSGSYRTSAALTGAATSLNGAFAGQNSNGNWTLTISDRASADIGRLGSWSLTIVPTPGSLAVVGMAAVLVGRRRR